MIVALASTCFVLAMLLGASLWMQQRERAQWAAERRELINRAIARHSGEVVALDRQARPVKPGPLDAPRETPVAVGL